MRRALFFLLLVFVFTGCDALGLGGNDDSPPNLSGPYEIETQNSGADVTYDLNLSESDDQLSGSGLLLIENPNSQQAVTSDLSISGSHNHPDVQLQMEIEETNATNSLEGTASDDGERVEGTLTLADGTQQDVVLRSE
jgi:hypothetical protein